MSKSKKKKKKIQQKRQTTDMVLWIIVVMEIVMLGLLLAYYYFLSTPKEPEPTSTVQKASSTAQQVKTGKIITEETSRTIPATEVSHIIGQTNHKFDMPVTTDVTKQVFAFTSSDGTRDDVPIYARAYIPATTKKQPIFAFAPGTTGLGDQCAPSLEDPSKHDWANYDSLMLAYASQGYAVVIIDYEGMRDASRMHHYMNGELEGKAVLDSIRALKNLPLSKNKIDDSVVFTAGYSQGGHASYWADQLKDKYAPELNLKGAIGYGPVTSVEQTLDDITKGANINWFGPYVLTSYADWYKHNYPVGSILLPKWTGNYQQESLNLCIDQVNSYWPDNIGANRSSQMYTPEFLEAAQKSNISTNPKFAQLAQDMAANLVGTTSTVRPKLINQGQHDNVILPSQSEEALARMCGKGNVVTYKSYTTSPYAQQAYNPNGLVDHYQTMNASFKDTLVWMQQLASGMSVGNNCK